MRAWLRFGFRRNELRGAGQRSFHTHKRRRKTSARSVGNEAIKYRLSTEDEAHSLESKSDSNRSEAENELVSLVEERESHGKRRARTTPFGITNASFDQRTKEIHANSKQ